MIRSSHVFYENLPTEFNMHKLLNECNAQTRILPLYPYTKGDYCSIGVTIKRMTNNP